MDKWISFNKLKKEWYLIKLLTAFLLMIIPLQVEAICSIDSTNVSFLSATASSTNIACKGFCTGSLSSTASGGVLPYSFIWSDGRSDAQRTGVCPGIFSVTVTDNSGQSATATTTISEPASSITVSIESSPTIPIQPCTGSAWVLVSGGVTPYSYLWDGFAGYSISDTVYNLCQREHCVSVTDYAGCTVQSCITIEIEQSSNVSDLSDEFIKIFPNPASSYLFIRPGGHGNYTIELRNMGGHVMLYEKFNYHHDIDISKLISGNYLILIWSDEKCIKKFVRKI